MKARIIVTTLTLTFAGFAGGCADGNNILSTASVTPPPAKVAMVPKIDPACVALASQIDILRKDGAVERLEKAASGKTASVQVKRTSLVKQAELNKANSDFQIKCGPAIPLPQAAQVTPQASATTAAAVVPAATAAATGAVGQQAKAAAVTTAQTAAQVAPKN